MSRFNFSFQLSLHNKLQDRPPATSTHFGGNAYPTPPGGAHGFTWIPHGSPWEAMGHKDRPMGPLERPWDTPGDPPWDLHGTHPGIPMVSTVESQWHLTWDPNGTSPGFYGTHPRAPQGGDAHSPRSPIKLPRSPRGEQQIISKPISFLFCRLFLPSWGPYGSRRNFKN